MDASRKSDGPSKRMFHSVMTAQPETMFPSQSVSPLCADASESQCVTFTLKHFSNSQSWNINKTTRTNICSSLFFPACHSATNGTTRLDMAGAARKKELNLQIPHSGDKTDRNSWGWRVKHTPASAKKMAQLWQSSREQWDRGANQTPAKRHQAGRVGKSVKRPGSKCLMNSGSTWTGLRGNGT